MQSDSVGVERRRLPFTLIENIILEDQELGPVDILVYLALAKHADGEGTCWPSMATIGRLARCARETVARSITHLEARGYLKRTARFRPDGGVTSNVYQLMPMEVKKYPPVAQDDIPCDLGSHPPVRQNHTNYLHSEQDPTKGETPERATLPARQPTTPLPAPLPEEQVLVELTDVPGLLHDRRFREGARRLLARGTTPGELVLAVRTAARDPQECGGLSFIADRFPRWARKAQEQARKDRENRQHESAEQERLERLRRTVKERARIQAEQDSVEGRELVEAAIAQLPWKRVRS
jgi:hypothetical protein